IHRVAERREAVSPHHPQRVRSSSMEDDGYPLNLSNMPKVPGGKVRILMISDRHVGEAEGEPETRVAATPEQLRQLDFSLAQQAIQSETIVVAGAGIAAGFPDEQYQAGGCQIIA